MYSDTPKLNASVLFPSIFKFSTEITTWIWLLILCFTNTFYFLILFILSIACMSLFAFPNDKPKDGPILVPGWTRILIEIMVIFLFGLYALFLLFGLMGLAFQSFLVFFTVIFEFQRYLWMLGFKSSQPEYLLYWKNVNK